MDDLEAMLRKTLNAVWSMGGEAHRLVFEPPAEQRAINEIEVELRVALPSAFRRVLRQISSHVDFFWCLPKDLHLPESLKEIFGGQLHWSLENLPSVDSGRQMWCEEYSHDSADEYERIWLDKLAFLAVGNGDYITLDVSDENNGQVIYLSHDGGDGHGYKLGDDFLDFLNRWVPLGCPGGEDWQWLPFTSGRTSGIDPDCENAIQWKRLLFREEEL